jgi:hypothetical protein
MSAWRPSAGPLEQLPRPREHPVQHRLGEAAGARVLLPQLNVSTPKQMSESCMQQDRPKNLSGPE